MDATNGRALVGAAMTLIGLIQATFYAVEGEPIPVALGILLAVIGIAYLWAEGITHDG